MEMPGSRLELLLGGEAAAFFTYGYAQRISKHPETFGKGNIEGVIAPEAANNAKEVGL
jgi:TctA family transporter